MTPQEYKFRLEDLRKQERELGREFVKNNPFKKLKGQIVNLTIGRRTEKVLFDGVVLEKDIFGKSRFPVLFYYRLKKDGTPRKNIDCLPVDGYDGIIYKIEKICRTQK